MSHLRTAMLVAICLTPFVAAQERPAEKTAEEKLFDELDKVQISDKIVKARQEYKRLLPLWQEERKKYMSSSNTYDYWQGPHGKAIIALGLPILPDIMLEIRKGDFFFNVPMYEITKLPIAQRPFSEQQVSATWIQWWDQSMPTPKPAAAPAAP